MTDRPTVEELEQLESAIRALPRTVREVFLAVRFDELTYRQIAAQTGLTAKQVERLFASALCRIARRLGRESKGQ